MSLDDVGQKRMLERMYARELRSGRSEELIERLATLTSDYKTKMAEKNQNYLYKSENKVSYESTAVFISKHMQRLVKTLPTGAFTKATLGWEAFEKGSGAVIEAIVDEPPGQ